MPLGPEYGRVQLKGLTLEEAATAIDKKLQAFLKEPNAWVTLPCHERPADAPLAPYTIKPNDLLYIMTAGAPPRLPIEGIYAVEPSGTVPLGPLYGRVNVQGLSLEAAEKAIEKKLRKILTDPKVSVTVAGWADPAGAIGPGPIAANTPSNLYEVKKPSGTVPKSTIRGYEVPQGQWNDGWKLPGLRPDKTVWTSNESPEFTLDFRRREAAGKDKEQKDLLLNLGFMLGNGGAIFPDAVHLVLTDSAGKARKLELMGPPGVAGRVDAFVVPVAPGINPGPSPAVGRLLVPGYKGVPHCVRAGRISPPCRVGEQAAAAQQFGHSHGRYEDLEGNAGVLRPSRSRLCGPDVAAKRSRNDIRNRFATCSWFVLGRVERRKLHSQRFTSRAASRIRFDLS